MLTTCKPKRERKENKSENEICNSETTLRSFSLLLTLSPPRLPLRLPLNFPPPSHPLLRHRRRRRDTDPSWIHLLRGLHPAPAQQNSEPEATEGVDDARLGQEGARVLHLLPAPQRSRPPLERIESALDRSSCRPGGRGAEADRR